MKTIVALPGEGIGIEVVDAACELMTAAGMPVKILTPPQHDAGGPAAGAPSPTSTRRAAREADAVLFGAAGPSTSGVVAWLRWEMEAWGGVRPAKFYRGMRSPLADPDGIDLVVIRENSEGMYPGPRGRPRRAQAGAAGLARPAGARARRLRRGALRGEGGDAPGRRAHRALRLRGGAEAQGAGPSRQGGVRDQVQRAPAVGRAVPSHRGGGGGAATPTSPSSTFTWTTPRGG